MLIKALLMNILPIIDEYSFTSVLNLLYRNLFIALKDLVST